MIAVFKLTKGFSAVVDNDDYDLSMLNWYAATIGNCVYAARDVGGRKAKKRVLLHRVIAERMGLDLTSSVVDHINGDGLDNRRCNLRAVTRAENARNLTGKRSNNTSGFMGVCYEPRYRHKWSASISEGLKRTIIGRFDTAEEANAARLVVEKQRWGVQPRREAAHA
jgi:hypothetical protein